MSIKLYQELHFFSLTVFMILSTEFYIMKTHAERSRQQAQERPMHVSREKVCKGQKGSDEQRTAKQPQGKPKCQKAECNSKKTKQKR